MTDCKFLSLILCRFFKEHQEIYLHLFPKSLSLFYSPLINHLSINSVKYFFLFIFFSFDPPQDWGENREKNRNEIHATPSYVQSPFCSMSEFWKATLASLFVFFVYASHNSFMIQLDRDLIRFCLNKHFNQIKNWSRIVHKYLYREGQGRSTKWAFSTTFWSHYWVNLKKKWRIIFPSPLPLL